jgi:hypothetical protein
MFWCPSSLLHPQKRSERFGTCCGPGQRGCRRSIPEVSDTNAVPRLHRTPVAAGRATNTATARSTKGFPLDWSIVNILEKLRERRLLGHQTRAWRIMHGVCLACTEESEPNDVLCSGCRHQLASNWTWTNDSPPAIVRASSHCRGDSASPCSGTPFVGGYCTYHSEVAQGLIKPNENKTGWTH